MMAKTAKKDVRRLKRWLVDDDNEEPTQTPHNPPTAALTEGLKLGDAVINQLFSQNDKKPRLRIPDDSVIIRDSFSRRAKSILNQQAVDSDDDAMTITSEQLRSLGETKRAAADAGTVPANAFFDAAAGRNHKTKTNHHTERPVLGNSERQSRANVNNSGSRSSLFQHLSDSSDSEIGSVSVHHTVHGSSESEKAHNGSLKEFRRQNVDLDDTLDSPIPVIARRGAAGRTVMTKSKAEQPSRASKPDAKPASEVTREVSKPRNTNRFQPEDAEGTGSVGVFHRPKTIAGIAAEMRERERGKQEDKELTADFESYLSQGKVSVPALQLSRPASNTINSELIAAPAALSAKVSSGLRNKIVLVGRLGSGGPDLVRAVAAVGAAAVVIVSGDRHPTLPRGKGYGDIRVPVVAISRRHDAMLSVGAPTSLRSPGGSESRSRESSPNQRDSSLLQPRTGSKEEQVGAHRALQSGKPQRGVEQKLTTIQRAHKLNRDESDSDDDDAEWRRQLVANRSKLRPQQSPPESQSGQNSVETSANESVDIVSSIPAGGHIRGEVLNAGANGSGQEVPLTQGMKEVLEWRLWGDKPVPVADEEQDIHHARNEGDTMEGVPEQSEVIDVRQPVNTTSNPLDASVVSLPGSGEKTRFFGWVDESLGRTDSSHAPRMPTDDGSWTRDQLRLSVEDDALGMEPENGSAFHQSLEKKAQQRVHAEPSGSKMNALSGEDEKLVGSAQASLVPGHTSRRRTKEGQNGSESQSVMTGDVRQAVSSRFVRVPRSLDVSPMHRTPTRPTESARPADGPSSSSGKVLSLSKPSGSPLENHHGFLPRKDAENQEKQVIERDPLQGGQAQERDGRQHGTQETGDRNKGSQDDGSCDPVMVSVRGLCDKLLERDAAYMASYVSKFGTNSCYRTASERQEVLDHLTTRLRLLFSSSLLHLQIQAASRLRELCRHKSSECARELVSAMAREPGVIKCLVDMLAREAKSGADEAEVLEARVSAAACFRHLALDEVHFRSLQYADQSFLGALGEVLCKDQNSETLQMTAAAVANLSVDSHENRGTICMFDSVLRGLDHVLCSGDASCQESALAALWNLSLDVDQVPRIVSFVSLSALASALEDGTRRAQHRGSGLVRNLLMCTASRAAVSREPAIAEALQKLKAHGPKDTAHRAQSALEMLSDQLPDRAREDAAVETTAVGHDQGLRLRGSAMKHDAGRGPRRHTQQQEAGGGVVEGGLRERRGVATLAREHGTPRAGEGQEPELQDSVPPLEVSRETASEPSASVVGDRSDVGGPIRPVSEAGVDRSVSSEVDHRQQDEPWTLVLKLMDARILALQAQQEASPGTEPSPPPPLSNTTAPVHGYFVVSLDNPPLPALFAKSSRQQAFDGKMEWKQSLYLSLPSGHHGLNTVARISLRIQSPAGTAIADARPIPLPPLLPLIQNHPTELPLLAISRKDGRTPLASARISFFLQPPLPALSPLSSPSSSMISRRPMDFSLPLPLPPPAEPDVVSSVSSGIRTGERTDDEISYQTVHSRTNVAHDSPTGKNDTGSESHVESSAPLRADGVRSEDSVVSGNADQVEEQVSKIVIRTGGTVLTVSAFSSFVILAGRDEVEDEGLGDTTEPTISEMRDDYEDEQSYNQEELFPVSDGQIAKTHETGTSDGHTSEDESADKSVQEKRDFWKGLEDAHGVLTKVPSPVPPPASATSQLQTVPPTNAPVVPQLPISSIERKPDSVDQRTFEAQAEEEAEASEGPESDRRGLSESNVSSLHAESMPTVDRSVDSTDLRHDAAEVASTTSTERREMGVQCGLDQEDDFDGGNQAAAPESPRSSEHGVDDLVALLERRDIWVEGSSTLENATRVMPRLCRLLKQLYRFERTRGALVAEAEGQADEAVLRQLGLDSSLTLGGSHKVTLVGVLQLLRDLCTMSPACLEAFQHDNSVAHTLLRILRPRNAKGGASAVLDHSRAGLASSARSVSAKSPAEEDPERKLLAADLLAKYAIRSEPASQPLTGSLSQLLATVQDQWWSGVPDQ